MMHTTARPPRTPPKIPGRRDFDEDEDEVGNGGALVDDGEKAETALVDDGEKAETALVDDDEKAETELRTLLGAADVVEGGLESGTVITNEVSVISEFPVGVPEGSSSFVRTTS